jgi:hypothetical protein
MLLRGKVGWLGALADKVGGKALHGCWRRWSAAPMG